MAKKSHRKSSRKITVPVVGTLIGLTAINAASNGAAAAALTGNFATAGDNIKQLLLRDDVKKNALKATAVAGLGMVGYSLARRAFHPSVSVGPVRVTI